MDIERIKNNIRNVPNFPKPGIQFKDISPILQNSELTLQKLKNKRENLGWVSATKTHNYMLKDGICDWLKLYGKTERVNYPVCSNPLTDQSRATHPAWQYRALSQNHHYPLFLNPQENVCMQFNNNLNTRLLERDNFLPKV